MSVEVTDRALASRKKRRKTNTIRIVDETPRKYTGSFHPTNLLQQKERFLKHGILPQFQLRVSSSHLEVLSSKPVYRVNHTYLQQAQKIIKLVKDKFKSGDKYFSHAFGERIDVKQASTLITNYLNNHQLDGQISIVWATDLDCSARMMWHGPNVKLNKPENRKHTLLIKNTLDNIYLRREGIICLMHHEIGTHHLRNINDGLQPWYSDRKAFGLRSLKSYEYKRTEEGLAAVNTLLSAKCKLLFGPAFVYYIACKSETMTFKELFYHLEQFVEDPERRWHYVMRVKRHLSDPNDLGGLGKDQLYFEGAMDTLLNIEDIDFPLLYSGALCLDELPRIKRLARLNCIKLPDFMSDVESYKQQLRWLGYLNGILPKPAPRKVKMKKASSLLTLRPSRESDQVYSRQSRRPPVKRQIVSCNEITAYTASPSPSNMVLIHANAETAEAELSKLSTPAIIKSVTPASPENNYNDLNSDPPEIRPLTSNPKPDCILENLTSKLIYHEDLLKQVETKLSSAALSIKNTERLIVHGVKGCQGVIFSQTEELKKEPTSSFELTRLKDYGEYTVQTRPPISRSHSTLQKRPESSLSKQTLTSRLPNISPDDDSPLLRNQKRVREGVLLLRRNKSSLDPNFTESYTYT